jgi:hypothetical protein
VQIRDELGSGVSGCMMGKSSPCAAAPDVDLDLPDGVHPPLHRGDV